MYGAVQCRQKISHWSRGTTESNDVARSLYCGARPSDAPRLTFPVTPSAPNEVKEWQVRNDRNEREWYCDWHSRDAVPQPAAVMRRSVVRERAERAQEGSTLQKRGGIQEGYLKGAGGMSVIRATWASQ